MPADRIETIVSLCKRRGFVYPSGEVYGVARSAWDFGPLGVELKENVRRQWWRATVQQREDVVGLDSAVLLGGDVANAAGHVEEFADRLTECQACHRRWRADRLLAEHAASSGAAPVDGLHRLTCSGCGARGAFAEPRFVSGLVGVQPGEGDPIGTHLFLRPETLQGIVLNFANVLQSARRRPPFGVGQVGKAFRNEIAPGDFIFRTREFEQMELAWFTRPGTDPEWHEYWLGERWAWYVGLGVRESNLRLSEQAAERSTWHAKRTVDIEYRYLLGEAEWAELEGVANRTDADLTAHARASGADLSYFDQEAGERWTPYVICASAGLNRCVLAFLLDALGEDTAPNSRGVPERRTLLRLDPRLAPVKAAVLPLSRNPDLSPRARDLAAALRRQWNVEFDDAGAIGRRYRRQDEIGTPYCVTVDFDTLTDQAVTIRDRDTMRQERVGIERVPGYLAERLIGC